MLIQCSVCKRVRKFGQWIKIADMPLPDIPIKDQLCDDCKDIRGGCEDVKKVSEEVKWLKRRFNLWDPIFAVMAFCAFMGFCVVMIKALDNWLK